jgi:hypothetical protein
MRLLPSALLGAAALLAGCGPLPLVSGSFEVAQVCKTLPAQSFQGVPISVNATVGTAMQVDLGSELASLQQEGVTLDVQLRSVTLKPRQGVTDFGFLDALKLSSPQTPDQAVLADYAKNPDAPAPVQLQLESQTPVNLAAVARDGQVKVDVTATGELPTSDWSVDAETCFSVNGTVDR